MSKPSKINTEMEWSDIQTDTVIRILLGVQRGKVCPSAAIAKLQECLEVEEDLATNVIMRITKKHKLKLS